MMAEQAGEEDFAGREDKEVWGIRNGWGAASGFPRTRKVFRVEATVGQSGQGVTRRRNPHPKIKTETGT